MADQLQEMLQKIYDEGVNKAKMEADKLIEDARQKSAKIVKVAEVEAEKLIAEAKKQAEDLEKNLNSDLKMAAQQAMSALKNKIISILSIEVLNKQTTAAMHDGEFLQKLILEVLGKWSPQSSLVLTVPENKQKELENFFANSAPKVFSGTLKVEFSPVMKEGVIVSPADGTYKLSFTDEDFANFFKSYLRPKATKILFGE